MIQRPSCIQSTAFQTFARPIERSRASWIQEQGHIVRSSPLVLYDVISEKLVCVIIHKKECRSWIPLFFCAIAASIRKWRRAVDPSIMRKELGYQDPRPSSVLLLFCVFLSLSPRVFSLLLRCSTARDPFDDGTARIDLREGARRINRSDNQHRSQHQSIYSYALPYILLEEGFNFFFLFLGPIKDRSFIDMPIVFISRVIWPRRARSTWRAIFSLV